MRDDQAGFIDGANILITGGTGSFGRAMVEHLITNYKPGKLIIYSRNEEKQVALRRDLDNPTLRFFIGDVRDRDRLALAFQGVHYVIHTAAMKHVDVCAYNPEECKKTNVDGAINIVNAAIQAKVAKVLAVSSDKAVNPTNTYGASKLLSDFLFIDGNAMSGYTGPKFSVIRFGNFEGSSESVATHFRRLKDAGAPTLPLTDRRMTRYFISLTDAVKCALNVLSDMKGGEIYIPKMRRLRIEELASSIYPGAAIKVIGRRPGEKLHEALITEPDLARTRNLGEFYLVSHRTDGEPVRTVLTSSGVDE